MLTGIRGQILSETKTKEIKMHEKEEAPSS